MSGGVTPNEANQTDGDLPFRVMYMFHPSFHVLDLTEAERWYERVFGQSSTRLGTGPQDPNNRWDYSTFTMIRDLLMYSIDPTLFIKEGKQQYPSIDEPHLKGFGWYVDGMPELYQVLHSAGIKVVGLLGEQGTDDEPPASLLDRSGTMIASPMFFTVPDNTGLRYQFQPPTPVAQDPRMSEGWEFGPRSEDDPLSIEFTSHHTILTESPERVLKLLDVLGGSVICEGPNEALGTMSTYVRLADTAYEIAVPQAGTPAHADLATTLPLDCYHSITFKVADLDKVRRHLKEQGIALRADLGSVIVTDPQTSMGIPWGFASHVLPGDDRV